MKVEEMNEQEIEMLETIIRLEKENKELKKEKIQDNELHVIEKKELRLTLFNADSLIDNILKLVKQDDHGYLAVGELVEDMPEYLQARKYLISRGYKQYR